MARFTRARSISSCSRSRSYFVRVGLVLRRLQRGDASPRARRAAPPARAARDRPGRPAARVRDAADRNSVRASAPSPPGCPGASRALAVAVVVEHGVLGEQLAVALVRVGHARAGPDEGLEHRDAAVLVGVGVASARERLGEELAEPRLVPLAVGLRRRDDRSGPCPRAPPRTRRSSSPCSRRRPTARRSRLEQRANSAAVRSGPGQVEPRARRWPRRRAR